MTRPLRIEYENAYYHVMNRGRRRQVIFHSKAYYQAFLQCIEQACQRFGIEIHAYCLMDNHYHLLIKAPKGNLSRAMRHINGVYTQKYNQLKKTDGALFRGRYKAILIEASNYLLAVSRYIHRNPVELKQPLVCQLIEYPWSSYPGYLNKSVRPLWLVRNDVFDELGVLHPVPAYTRYVERGLDLETQSFYAKNHWPAMRGSEAFKEIADANALSFSRKGKASEDKQAVPIKKIIQAVALFYSCDKKTIERAPRGRGQKNYPRWVAMKLSQDLSGQNLSTIGQYFWVGNCCTVSRTIGRLNTTLALGGEVAESFKRIRKDLTP